jgi:hypothetical protein
MRASLLLLHSLLLLLLLLLLVLLLLLLLHHHVRYLMLILLLWLGLLLRRLAIGHFSTRLHWHLQRLNGSQSESRNRERATFHHLKYTDVQYWESFFRLDLCAHSLVQSTDCLLL